MDLKAILALILSLCSLSFAAQAGPLAPKGLVQEWNVTFGGPYGDGIWSLQGSIEGGYYLTGYSSQMGQGSDLWLARVGPKGDLIWERSFGGSGEDVGYLVRETHDGGCIVAGSTDSFGMGEERVWLLKVDKNGSLQWDRIYGGFVSSLGDGAWSVDQTQDGGFIVAGYTQSFGQGKKDMWLLKLRSTGEPQWERCFGGQEDDVGMSVISTGHHEPGGEGYVIAGRTASYGQGASDMWLLQTDSQGNGLWNVTFGGARDDAAFQVIEVEDGYALAGRSESGPDNKRVVLIKTDRQGKKLWERAYKGSTASSLQQGSDGGFIIAGRLDSDEWGRDALVIEIASDGKQELYLQIREPGDGMATAAMQSDDGCLIVAGIRTQVRGGPEDGWLMKLCPDDAGTGLNADEVASSGNTSLNFAGYPEESSLSTGMSLPKLEKIFKDKLQ